MALKTIPEGVSLFAVYINFHFIPFICSHFPSKCTLKMGGRSGNSQDVVLNTVRSPWSKRTWVNFEHVQKKKRSEHGEDVAEEHS